MSADEAPVYEVAKIVGHHIDQRNELRFKVQWNHYPEKAATMERSSEIRDSAKVAIAHYLAQFGLKDVGDIDTLNKNLRASMMTEKAYKEAQKPCWLTKVTGQSRDEKGKVVYKTEFDDGSILSRPATAFMEEYEKDILREYLESLKDTPKPKKNRNVRSPPGSAWDRPLAPLTGTTRRTAPRCSQESLDDEDGERPGPSRQRFSTRLGTADPRSYGDRRSNSPAVSIDSGSEAPKVSTPVVRHAAARLPMRMARKGSDSSVFSSPRGESGSARKRLLTGPADVLPKKIKEFTSKQEVNDPRRAMSIYTDDGKNKMVVKDENGETNVVDMDEEFEKNPQFVFAAMKDLLLDKQRR